MKRINLIFFVLTHFIIRIRIFVFVGGAASLTSEECTRDRQGDLLPAIRFGSYMAALEPAIAHPVQINSQFVIHEKVKVGLVELGHLALCEEVAAHLFGQF